MYLCCFPLTINYNSLNIILLVGKLRLHLAVIDFVKGFGSLLAMLLCVVFFLNSSYIKYVIFLQK